MADDEGSDGIEGSAEGDVADDSPDIEEPGTVGDDTGVESDASGTESLGDGIDVESLANHVVYVAAAFGVTGLGFGVAVVLLSQFGADATIVEGTLGQQTSAAFTEAIINIGITVALFFPLFLAPVAGLVVNLSVEDQLTTLFAATFGVLLGAVLFYVIAGYTGGIQFPTRTAARGGEYSYRFVLRRGVVDSLLVGIVSGAVAGVSAVIGQHLE